MKQKNKIKKTIIQSAIVLFAQKGLKDTSIADIMQKANLGIGTFYNYFQSKDDLLRSLLIQLAMDIRQHYLESINKEKTQAQVLEGLVLYTANLLDQNRFILPLFMRAVDRSALTIQPHVSIKNHFHSKIFLMKSLKLVKIMANFAVIFQLKLSQKCFILYFNLLLLVAYHLNIKKTFAIN